MIMVEKPERRYTVGDSLMWLSLLTAVVLWAVLMIRSLNVSGCSSECDYDQIHGAFTTYFVLALVLLVATLITYLVLRKRTHRSWIIPAGGILATVVTFVICERIFTAGFG